MLYETRFGRREFLGLLGASVLGAGVSDLYSAEQGIARIPQKPEEPAVGHVPSYDEFKALLEKKGKYNIKSKIGLKRYWEKTNDKRKQRVYLMESDPEDYIKKHFTDRDKAEFSKFDFSDNKVQALSDFGTPWKVRKKDLSDKIYAFEIKGLFEALLDAKPSFFRYSFP